MRDKPGGFELGLIGLEVLFIASFQWGWPIGIGACIASFIVVQIIDRKTAYVIAVALGLGWYWLANEVGGLSWGLAMGAVGILLNLASMMALRSEGAYAQPSLPRN